MRRIIWITGILVVAFVAVMQIHRPNFDLTPVNHAATFEAQLRPDSQIHGVLQKSCYSCHSTQAEIPWYGHIWPASVLMQNDIRRGRARIDFSNWSNLSTEMSHLRLVSACRAMRESKMPKWYFELTHPGSSPSRAEAEAFCQWVYASPLRPEVAETQ